MAKEKVKTLRTIVHHLNEKMVDISWSVDTYVDGELLASERHGGAYPVLPDGELFDPGKTAEGVCIADLLGQAGADALSNVDALKIELECALARAKEGESKVESLSLDNQNLFNEIERISVVAAANIDALNIDFKNALARAEEAEINVKSLTFENEKLIREIESIRAAAADNLGALMDDLKGAVERTSAVEIKVESLLFDNQNLVKEIEKIKALPLPEQALES